MLNEYDAIVEAACTARNRLGAESTAASGGVDLPVALHRKFVHLMFSLMVQHEGARMDVESEIMDLKRRVGDLEGAVNVLTGQVAKVDPHLIALATKQEGRFDKIEDLVGRLNGRLDLLNTQLWSLRDDLPDLLRDGIKKGLGP